MKKRTILLSGLLAAFAFFTLLVQPALADVAPPFQPPGSNVAPGSEPTQVQMTAEEVIIEVQTGPYPGTPPDNRGGNLVDDWARVTATFWMVNQGSTTEQMEVLFPLANPQGWGDGFSNDPEIDSLIVQVEGNISQTTRKALPSLWDEGDEVNWAAFEVVFPPGEEVLIEVRYNTLATGYPPLATFSYFLETGSGWYGPIGSADLIVRLPYEASIENTVLLDYETTPGAALTDNEIRWHFDDLEPEAGFNLEVTLVEVDKWNEILRTRQTAAAAPQNGDAWGELARACKLAIITNKGYLLEGDGAAQLFEESRTAYEKATTLKPEAALWHAGYGELLWTQIIWTYQDHPNTLDKTIHELYTALELDPDNQQALYTLYEIYYATNGVLEEVEESHFDFLVLTATLTPRNTSTPQPSETPIPSVTPSKSEVPPTTAPTRTNSPQAPSQTIPIITDAQPTPESKDDRPLCGGSLTLVPFTMAGLILFKRRERIPR
jgi:hypothetical protein